MARALRHNRFCVRAAAIAAMLAATLCAERAAQAIVQPHTSETTLPSSNGRGAIAWNTGTYRLSQFLEHAYQNPTSTTATRQFIYDSYPGVRIGSTGTWLSSVAPELVEYLPGTGIIHAMRTLSGYTIDEYDFAPMSLEEDASVMIVTVTNDSASAAIDVYSLFNYYVGSPISGSITPGDDGETMTYDASNGAYYESGPSNVAFAFIPIGTTSYHGCVPNNPYGLLNSGSNLMDDTGSNGAITGAVAGFQTSLGTPATATSQTLGWITIMDPSNDGQAAAGRVATWVNGRSASKILSDEIAGWASWVKPAPAGASSDEAKISAMSQVMVRMGQVTEAAPSNGQILASIAPGEWNISWARDMAYSTVALAKSGHYAEAKAALAFYMGATANTYESYVGKPYQVSVCRYFGDGVEQSDSNSDGPNVEFDGFGLFLWALDEYVKASGDTATLTTWWPTVKSQVADVLVSLQDTSTGLIAADSSIWEVHWDGQQKHFAYTTIAAANGLCSAARLATAAGDTADVATYNAAGAAARDGILHSLRMPTGAIGQSLEAVTSATAWVDAAVIEAVNFGLFDPTRGTAAATLQAIEANLVPPSGRGFFRDQGGGTYDTQEWIFIDLRMQRAMELSGDTADQQSLFLWNTEQGIDNFGELSELHDATTGNYAGASPMVGFGAGAYLIALADRGTALVPTCGAFASEPSLTGDGGTGSSGGDGGGPVGADGGPVTIGGEDGGSVTSLPDAGIVLSDASLPSGPGTSSGGAGASSDGGGAASSPGSSSSGCSCSAVAASGSSGASALIALTVGAFGFARRRRARRDARVILTGTDDSAT